MKLCVSRVLVTQESRCLRGAARVPLRRGLGSNLRPWTLGGLEGEPAGAREGPQRLETPESGPPAELPCSHLYRVDWKTHLGD